jgi:hypothetical protein
MYEREKDKVSQQQDLYKGGELWLPWRWLRNGALSIFSSISFLYLQKMLPLLMHVIASVVVTALPSSGFAV